MAHPERLAKQRAVEDLPVHVRVYLPGAFASFRGDPHTERGDVPFEKRVNEILLPLVALQDDR